MMLGIPCFTGTRIPVQTLIDFLETGESIDDFLAVSPYIPCRQILTFLGLSRDITIDQLEDDDLVDHGPCGRQRRARPGASDEVIMSIACHVSRAMLSRYSHVRMEAKRHALDEIAARQNAADEKRQEVSRKVVIEAQPLAGTPRVYSRGKIGL